MSSLFSLVIFIDLWQHVNYITNITLCIILAGKVCHQIKILTILKTFGASIKYLSNNKKV